MKFWTTDPDFPDKLVIDMIQCDECDKWIPEENFRLHELYHKKQREQSLSSPADLINNDPNIPKIVMETIPCEDCMVLVPKGNIDIHKAHVCRSRMQQLERQRQSKDDDPPLISEIYHEMPAMETIECEACHILVPIHNLVLHQAHACTALYGDVRKSETSREEDTLRSSDPQSYVLGGDDTFDEWECPRCTYLNIESDSDSNWKCSMCEYTPLGALDESNEKDETPAELPHSQAQELKRPQAKPAAPFWRSLVKKWVPEDIQKHLPPSLKVDPDEEIVHTLRGKAHKKGKNKDSKRARPPAQSEVRSRRSKHLSWLERERQQYLQLLKTTRQEQRLLRMQEEAEKSNGSEKEAIARDVLLGTEKSEDQTIDVGALAHLREQQKEEEQQRQQQGEAFSTKIELLLATEQLCLHHLEQNRRTHLVQELTHDIALLGLPRWRHHLHHLLDLYQSAGEIYVDTIIWELRMHFMQYAILEVMALLELAVWKAQLGSNNRQLLGSNNGSSSERRACRNDKDISTICRSVLPFLGRPLTAALRAL